MKTQTHYDVIIVGLGPVGAVVANYAGLWGLKTLVLEKEKKDHGQPRAFSCDEEAMRIYQQLLLDEKIKKVTFADDLVDYVGVRNQVFAQIAMGQVDTGYGFTSLHLFHQPALEEILRDGIKRFENVKVSSGWEVTTLSQNGAVKVKAKEVDTGEEQEYATSYLLACDGARSNLRSHLGISMDGVHYEEPWLAVSGIVQDEYVKIENTSFICHPYRPVFVGRGPFNQYRLEFKLRPGESADQLEQKEMVDELLSPYVNPDKFTIQRATVYTFHNKMASSWKKGNVFLLGDAAHTMPPFMGQGLVSGLRDTANLIWKIALVLKGANASILDSYQTERQTHTQKMADMSVKMGKIFLTPSKFQGQIRDFVFSFIQLFPSVKNFLRYLKFKPKPVHDSGLYISSKSSGTYFPQPYLKNDKGETVRLDDIIGKGFAIISRSSLIKLSNRNLWEKLDPIIINIKDYEDKKGIINNWFDQNKASVAVLRPDRFVLATATDQNFSEVEKSIEKLFSINQTDSET